MFEIQELYAAMTEDDRDLWRRMGNTIVEARRVVDESGQSREELIDELLEGE